MRLWSAWLIVHLKHVCCMLDFVFSGVLVLVRILHNMAYTVGGMFILHFKE